jgi:hypothetical protein
MRRVYFDGTFFTLGDWVCVSQREAPMTKAQEAWQRATMCSDRAEIAHNEESRRFFTHLRNSWIKVANGYQMSRMEEDSGSSKYPPAELGEGLPR